MFGGITPSWWTPPWSNVFEDFEAETPLRGREFRVGVTRGRPLGKEFGVSFVRKSWTDFSFVRQGVGVASTNFGSQAARITFSPIESVQIPGVEFHTFIPMDRIGSRVQLGALLGGGGARVPGTRIQKRIEGPPFVASPSNSQPLPTVPAGGGFVYDENGDTVPVAPGQTGVTVTARAREISPLDDFVLLARAQIAADVLLAAPFKLRFSAGYNHPGAQLFGVEMVYLFGYWPLTRGRVSALLVALVLSLGVTRDTGAQSLSNAPASSFDPAVSPFTLPSNSLFDVSGPPEGGPHATSMFDAGQIVDCPTGDLRPRFHWGLLGSLIPNWTTPGNMGNFLFDDLASVKMSGRDFRIGVVRARQVGFELGISFVRKTVSSFTIVETSQFEGDNARVTYTPLGDVRMTGVDSHLVFPIARIGERVQLGILAGGGFAWTHDRPIQKRIEGPPFYADADSFVELSSPPATGGFVRDTFGEWVPLVPNTTYGIASVSVLENSPIHNVWPLIRGQFAADFLLARPLKLRLAAGYHYPGAQALGVDVIYLFSTGRNDAARVQPPVDPGGAPGTPAAQVADRPQVIAPRRSVLGRVGRHHAVLVDTDVEQCLRGSRC